MDHYEIIIESHVDPKRLRVFEGMALQHLPDGKTRLSGVLRDQAALFSTLSRIRDMNLKLALVRKNDEVMEE